MEHRREITQAGLVAAALSGAPSTVHALVTRRPLLESTIAAGSLLVPREERATRLLLAALPVHVALSLFWTAIIATVPPKRKSKLAGAVIGCFIGIFDLKVIGRRAPRIRALPFGPQLADHVLFGMIAAGMLERSRSARSRPS